MRTQVKTCCNGPGLKQRSPHHPNLWCPQAKVVFPFFNGWGKKDNISQHMKII